MKELNPRALAVMDEFDRQLAKLGGCRMTVIVTEDMTQAEEEMALFEGFLKEGYPEDMAATKAKEWMALTSRLR